MFRPCRVPLCELDQTSPALFAVCKPPLCWSDCSPTKNTLCFTMWGNKPNWAAVTCASATDSGATATGLLVMKSLRESPTSVASKFDGGSTNERPISVHQGELLLWLPSKSPKKKNKSTKKLKASGLGSHKNCQLFTSIVADSVFVASQIFFFPLLEDGWVKPTHQTQLLNLSVTNLGA